MKKLLLLLTILLPMGASAQKIVADNVDEYGTRMVMCSSETFRSMTDKLVLSLGMSAVEMEGKEEPQYLLDATITSNNPISCPPNPRMLIKTQTGTVITLEGWLSKTIEDNIGELKDLGSAGLWKTFSISIPFKITPEEVLQIASEGVAKIRIELNGDTNYEKEWKKDKKIGKYIADSFKVVKDAITKDKRGSFSDDF